MKRLGSPGISWLMHAEMRSFIANQKAACSLLDSPEQATHPNLTHESLEDICIDAALFSTEAGGSHCKNEE